MDWLTAGFWFALGYLVRCIPWGRRRPLHTADPEIFSRAREAARNNAVNHDEIARAAEERMRRAREGRNAS